MLTKANDANTIQINATEQDLADFYDQLVCLDAEITALLALAEEGSAQHKLARHCLAVVTQCMDEWEHFCEPIL